MKLGNFLRIALVTLTLSGYSAWTQTVREGPRETTSSAEVAGIPLVRLADAEELWYQSSTLFVDVRSPTDYAFGHIAGAINIPDEEFEKHLPTYRPQLERARAIVLYCKSTDCGKSLWSALRLRNAGLTQAHIYPEGWNEWVNRGLPVTRHMR